MSSRVNGDAHKEGSRHTVAALPRSVPEVRAALDRVLESQAITGQRATDIKLAVTEACTNAVQHAYPQGAPGDIVVIFQPSYDALTVSVLDHGRGIDLPTDNPGLGVGLRVIEAVADSVVITSLHPGTSVRMTFHR